MIFVVIANSPLQWGFGVDSNQSHSVVVVTRDLDIEIPIIINALDSPRFVFVNLLGNFPLRSGQGWVNDHGEEESVWVVPSG